MSGFQNAVRVSPSVVVIARTCDGDGAWECGNRLLPGQVICTDCATDDDYEGELS